MKSVFFLWLNDTTLSRYYWNQSAQNWTTSYMNATKFDSRKEAEDEAVYAGRDEKAQVLVQELYV